MVVLLEWTASQSDFSEIYKFGKKIWLLMSEPEVIVEKKKKNPWFDVMNKLWEELDYKWNLMWVTPYGVIMLPFII